MAHPLVDKARHVVVETWSRVLARRALINLIEDRTQVDLSLVGRTLLHAAAVGLAAGLASASFFWALELAQGVLLEGLVGYQPLRAAGEHAMDVGLEPAEAFHPWRLVVLMVLGGLGCGLVTRWAPEVAGGGGDVAIRAFHERPEGVRLRVAFLKPLASVMTLGTGGSGGREGPTMLLGAAIGSLTARLLGVSARERRILLVAGMAAGICAMFRTPLGAALLAVEVLYRDGFEQEALIPSILASVAAYSVVITIFGPSTLFGHAARFAFIPAHLPWYVLMAIMVAMAGALFVRVLRSVGALAARLPVAPWLRPAVGAMVLAVVVVPLLVVVGGQLGHVGRGLGLLGGGYGAVQVAISGAAWMPAGWEAVALLALLAMAKLVASSITIGSGGSAGDFAPSLAIGGLVGGAFGRAVQLWTGDTSIDPGAFALVGMGTFYGGVGHVPLSALVLVCEMAGNYDLLVPLMLALGVSFVGLRNVGLYHAQRATPGSRSEAPPVTLLVAQFMEPAAGAVILDVRATAPDLQRRVAEAEHQQVFPVRDDAGALVGMITPPTLRALAGQSTVGPVIAADLMQPLVAVRAEEDLAGAARKMLGARLRQLPVLDAAGTLVGFLDEGRVAALYMAGRAETDGVQPTR